MHLKDFSGFFRNIAIEELKPYFDRESKVVYKWVEKEIISNQDIGFFDDNDIAILNSLTSRQQGKIVDILARLISLNEDEENLLYHSRKIAGILMHIGQNGATKELQQKALWVASYLTTKEYDFVKMYFVHGSNFLDFAIKTFSEQSLTEEFKKDKITKDRRMICLGMVTNIASTDEGRKVLLTKPNFKEALLNVLDNPIHKSEINVVAGAIFNIVRIVDGMVAFSDKRSIDLFLERLDFAYNQEAIQYLLKILINISVIEKAKRICTDKEIFSKLLSFATDSRANQAVEIDALGVIINIILLKENGVINANLDVIDILRDSNLEQLSNLLIKTRNDDVRVMGMRLLRQIISTPQYRDSINLAHMTKALFHVLDNSKQEDARVNAAWMVKNIIGDPTSYVKRSELARILFKNLKQSREDLVVEVCLAHIVNLADNLDLSNLSSIGLRPDNILLDAYRQSKSANLRESALWSISNMLTTSQGQDLFSDNKKLVECLLESLDREISTDEKCAILKIMANYIEPFLQDKRVVEKLLNILHDTNEEEIKYHVIQVISSVSRSYQGWLLLRLIDKSTTDLLANRLLVIDDLEEQKDIIDILGNSNAAIHKHYDSLQCVNSIVGNNALPQESRPLPEVGCDNQVNTGLIAIAAIMISLVLWRYERRGERIKELEAEIKEVKENSNRERPRENHKILKKNRDTKGASHPDSQLGRINEERSFFNNGFCTIS